MKNAGIRSRLKAPLNPQLWKYPHVLQPYLYSFYSIVLIVVTFYFIAKNEKKLFEILKIPPQNIAGDQSELISFGVYLK
jgi:hypothetical protein